MTDFQLTQLAISVGTLTAIAVGLYKDARNRRWDQEDKRLIKKDAEDALKAASAKVTETVEASAREAKEDAKVTQHAIAVNTELTVEAKDVAQQALDATNGANGKIAELKKELDDVKNGRVK